MAPKRTFMDEAITKETIALGIGGQIVRGDGFPELPKRSRVKFTAYADYENVKHRFLENGGVEETLILTVEAKSFEVISIEEQPQPDPLPFEEKPAKRGGSKGGLAAVGDPTPADS